jgi:CxC6 like cysteine cluster associated with KDZ transposases/CxC5 like cysteine cluster associated with KDZ transposases
MLLRQRSTHVAGLLSDCKTVYHPNYSVFNGVRTYYSGIPNEIQVGDHQYVEKEVLDLFIGLMLISWFVLLTIKSKCGTFIDTSLCIGRQRQMEQGYMTLAFQNLSDSQNMVVGQIQASNFGRNMFGMDFSSWHFCRTIMSDMLCLEYLIQAYRKTDSPKHSKTTMTMSGDMDSQSGLITVISAAGCQSPQMVHHVNAHQFIGPLTHLCTYCIGKLHVLVIDGITIGHPCCGIAHCPVDLTNNQHRFCPIHQHQHNVCAVEGCEAPVEKAADKSYMTCSISEHRLLEDTYKLRNKAMFQLKGRLQRADVSTADDAFAAEITAEEVEERVMPADTADPACPAKKDADGNRKICALFGRRRTHNEQIFVRPCGIIVARATFFGSETVPQTADMIHKVFRVQGSMPDIIFYDNNCSMYKHLRAQGDNLYKFVGFPVDVFHWKCKHKKSDVECSVHCNPYTFKELLGEEKTWYFNSSIAEQTNVWLGGYHSILPEMGAAKYEFFLNEMIRRKNILTIEKLENDKARPSRIPGLTYS